MKSGMSNYRTRIFAKIWNSSSTLEEAQARTNLSKHQICDMAYRLRKKGVKIKHMDMASQKDLSYDFQKELRKIRDSQNDDCPGSDCETKEPNTDSSVGDEIRRDKSTMGAEQFVIIWQTSISREQVMSRTGMKWRQILYRVKTYRKMGVPLKDYTVNNPKLDIERLKELCR